MVVVFFIISFCRQKLTPSESTKLVNVYFFLVEVDVDVVVEALVSSLVMYSMWKSFSVLDSPPSYIAG